MEVPRFQQKLNSSECKDSTEIHESKGWQRWWKGFYNANVDLWDKANVMMKFGKDGGKAGNCYLADKFYQRIERGEGF